MPTDPGPSSPDRRRAPRVKLERLLTCYILPPGATTLLTGGVLDLSRHGVSLLLHTWIEPGTVLRLTLPRAAGVHPRGLATRVSHCTRSPDGTYVLGGEFLDGLSDAELAALVA